VQDINPNKYVADITYTNMSINKGKNVSLPMEEQKGNLSVKYNPINYSTTSGISIPNAGPLMDNVPHDLSRPVPSHKMNANRSANIYIQQKEQKKIPLERNRPLTSVKTSLGQSYGSDTYSVSSRDKKLKYTIRPQGGMSGRGTKVKIEMDRSTQFKSSQNKMNIIKQSNVTQGFRNQ